MSRIAMNKANLILALFIGFLVVASDVSANTFENGIPEGWTCEGSCGALGADGVVTLAPSGSSHYGWVSTSGGVYGLGLP